MAQTTPLDAFYTQLDRLIEAGQGIRLSECSGNMDWPERGVYFFLEDGERRRADPALSRVVRVGTHAVSEGARSTLWGRLRQHQGSTNGGGNHRGSVFRLHVGAALLQRDGLIYPTWGKGSTATAAVRAEEVELEQGVSRHLGAMRVLWVDIPDAPGKHSQRAFIERNAIALLSNSLAPVDAPSPEWLGKHSPTPEIRASGLWHVNFVRNSVEPGFPERFEAIVDAMLR